MTGTGGILGRFALSIMRSMVNDGGAVMDDPPPCGIFTGGTYVCAFTKRMGSRWATIFYSTNLNKKHT